MTEGMQPMPEDPYGIAKYAVEQELRASHMMFNLDYIIFRPTTSTASVRTLEIVIGT